jgi:hypothetical protein
MEQRDGCYTLTGIVELDDTYIGKSKKGGKRCRGSVKTKVMIALSKDKAGKLEFIK